MRENQVEGKLMNIKIGDRFERKNCGNHSDGVCMVETVVADRAVVRFPNGKRASIDVKTLLDDHKYTRKVS